MPNHDLHQHDLIPDAARRIVAESEVDAGQRVCEFGAGTGALTAVLLETGAQVLAIELDPARCHMLHRRFPQAVATRQLTILCHDLLTCTPQLKHPWRVIANPPFNCTAPLLRRLFLETFAHGWPMAIDLVLQEQAARKWSGAPQAQTQSSCLAHGCGQARTGITMPRGCTVPPSHVALALWHWRAAPEIPGPELRRALDRLLTIAFAGPHTVREALRSITTPAILKRQARDHGWDPDAHPRTLAPQAWLMLAGFLQHIGKL